MIRIVTFLFFEYPILGALSLLTMGLLTMLTISASLGLIIFIVGLIIGFNLNSEKL